MLRPLLRDKAGTTTVEFAVILPLFLILFFGILDFSLAFYWIKSAEKAAQLGARLAVVRMAAPPGVPQENTLTNPTTYFYGQSCSEGACIAFAPVSCTGTACGDAASDFQTHVLAGMQRIFPLIEPENVTLRYGYLGLGYAGGPTVPAVTVELAGIDYPLNIVGPLLPLIGGNQGGHSEIPTVRATLTGEDLSPAGAS